MQERRRNAMQPLPLAEVTLPTRSANHLSIASIRGNPRENILGSDDAIDVAQIPNKFAPSATVQRIQYFVGFGITSLAVFGKYQFAVGGHVEYAPCALDELRFDAELRLDFSCQTDSPRAIVSDAAILDGDLHGHPRPLRSLRTSSVPAASALSFPRATSRDSGTMPQLVQG